MAPSLLQFRSRITPRWAPLLLLLPPLLLLLTGITGFPYADASAHFSDMAISHYPYAVYLRDSLLNGRFPLWNPLILSGAPFAANPLSGLWYPPGWPALLFPLPFGFNLMIVLHMAWGAWGLYLLLKAQGLREPAALFGGLAFVLLPKLYAHYGAGHLTLLYAVAWMPWLLLAARLRPGRDVEACSTRIGWPVCFPQFAFWEAVILALIFLADPRWSVYAGLAWLGYCFWMAVEEAQDLGSRWRGRS